MWILTWLPNYVFHILVIVGIVGFFVVEIFRFIPAQYSVPIKILSIIILAFGIYIEGTISNQEAWEMKVADLKLQIAKKEADSVEITANVITKYVETVKIVKEKGDVIIKEVPKYITKNSDSKCSIPNAFVMLHDNAVLNQIPDASAIVDERTNPIKLSTVTGTVVGNYSICHQNAEQLKALQGWILLQQENFAIK